MTNVMRAVLLLLCIASSLTNLSAEVDTGLPEYSKVPGVSGGLSSIGSDTLNNLITLWAEDYKKLYPNVQIQVEGKGSGTAPPALISGTAQLGPMSRAMKSSELDEFEKVFHYPPTEIKVAVDALAVFLHKDNPLAELSLEQIDAIFSKNRRRGGGKNIVTWGELGLTGEWASKPISLYGRNSASGTYGFFKEAALQNGDFKDTVKEQPGSASVVQSISVDKYAIGYSGIGYRTAGVKALKIASDAETVATEPSAQNAFDGSYPLARYLLIYINKNPTKPAQLVVQEFIRFILSKAGQKTVEKDGYYPLTTELAAEGLKSIDAH